MPAPRPVAKVAKLARAAGACAALLIAATPALAQQDDRLKSVDSILDRLESRLLDQESDGLTFGEKLPPPDTGAPATRYKFDGKGRSKVEGKTSEQTELRAIATMIDELESQVDQLASSVQKTKQSILDEAGIDNFIALEARLTEADAAALTALTIRLDGFDVYAVQDASGLWLPAKMIPLYAGPLQPGRHRIDLEARLAMKHDAAMPLNGDVYRFVNKSFDITVPGGTVNTRYVISILPPAKLDGTADATIKEAI
jgi:hypothetical protein